MHHQGIMQILQFENLLTHQHINHFSTTRTGGTSQDNLASLNLGYTVGDKPLNVTQNLGFLAKSLGIERSQFVFPKQNHSVNIEIVESSNNIFPDTDALITNVPGICIAVRTADCVPVLLYDPIQKAIAAIHSGWKGTLQKITNKTIVRMTKAFGCNPGDIIAGIGPSIGPEVYEVGKDVIDGFDKEFKKNTFFKAIKDSDKALLNLWKANEQILLDSGVPKKNIEIAEMCTYSNPNLFYSARRDGQRSGRLATGIMLK